MSLFATNLLKCALQCVVAERLFTYNCTFMSVLGHLSCMHYSRLDKAKMWNLRLGRFLQTPLLRDQGDVVSDTIRCYL